MPPPSPPLKHLRNTHALRDADIWLFDRMDHIHIEPGSPSSHDKPQELIHYVCSEFLEPRSRLVLYPFKLGEIFWYLLVSEPDRNEELLEKMAALILANLWFGLLGKVLGAGTYKDGNVIGLNMEPFIRRQHPSFPRVMYLCTNSLVAALEARKDLFDPRMEPNHADVVDLVYYPAQARAAIGLASRTLRQLEDNIKTRGEPPNAASLSLLDAVKEKLEDPDLVRCAMANYVQRLRNRHTSTQSKR